jgi:hypothetical protein
LGEMYCAHHQQKREQLQFVFDHAENIQQPASGRFRLASLGGTAGAAIATRAG